jgi:hypothetical protein
MSEISRRDLFAAAVLVQGAAVARAHAAQAPPERRLLSSVWPLEKLQRALLPREQWHPYPPAAERAPWEALPLDIRASALEAGEEALSGPWPSLSATLFLEYVREGNRSRYEGARNARRNRLRDLTLAECIEGKGRFLDQIANGVWLTCEESFWGVPAHMNLQKRGPGLPDVTEHVIDLFAAETASQLAWTEYLLGPQLAKIHPLVRERIVLEIERRILSVYRDRDDFGWMGLNPRTSTRPVNNWNPWINSNCLACALLLESEQNRPALVHKIVRSLDRFLDGYHEDGGCDEGPSYWGRAGGSLFDDLELLHSASGGVIDFYRMPLVREIGRYIYRAHIADHWYTNFADASARLHIAGDLVFRYGKRIEDPHMQALGAWAARDARGLGGGGLLRDLPALFNAATVRNAEARQPLVRDVWLPGVQVMAARRNEGSAEGLYLAAQGGHNAESHNHNDVGNFIVYADGQPAIIDVGVETYTAKTFSSRRYEIWTMQSAYHNVPTVNGVMQAAGRQYEAREVSYRADGAGAEFALDIAAAYPPEAGIEMWRRRIRLDRNRNTVEVQDNYVLQKSGGAAELTLMTPCEAAVAAPGELALSGGFLSSGKLKVSFPEGVKAAIEEVPITDTRLRPVWGERVRRVRLSAVNLPAKGEFLVRIEKV